MKIRVARQHHAAVRVVFAKHVRPGPNRPPVERQVLDGHARLGKEAVSLSRHGCEERHGQPVEELRVLAFDVDAPRVSIDFLNP